jgi:pimeloyl-ACP methyl ester carboxylesterase
MATDPPVILVHGLGSSFEHNWRATGWVDLLADEGREVVGADLPGHGTMREQNPSALSPAQAVLAAVGSREQVDAVGFSAGAHAVLAAAAAAPQRFRKLAVLGIGNPATPGLGSPGLAASAADVIVAGLESGEEPDDQAARMIRRLTRSSGNDRFAVAGFLRAGHPAVTLADVARIEVRTLVVLGDQDFAGPADALLGALRHGELVTLRGVDHFATPSDYGCIDAVLKFLAG